MNDLQTRETFPLLDESLLTHLPPFSKLAKQQIREILDLAHARRYDGGAAIFDEDAKAERFFMLLDGHVRVVHVTPAGQHVTALYIPSGQLIGIAKVLGRETYPATAMTASEAIVLSWPMRLWDQFAATYDGFISETYKMVGDRLNEMNKRIVELASQQVEQRVANALLRLINQSGRRVDNGIEIDFPITRQDLSELTATTLHTVSRLLSRWERQGIVQSRRRHITVIDPHALVELTQA